MPLLQMSEIRGMDSLLLEFYNAIHLAISLKVVFSWKSDASAVSTPVKLVHA